MFNFLVCAFFISFISTQINGRNIFENNPFLQQGNNNQQPQQSVISQVPFQIVSINGDPHHVPNQSTNFVVNTPALVDNQLGVNSSNPVAFDDQASSSGNQDDAVEPRGKCLKPRGQFPSSKCNKFVNCWDGLSVEQYCPNGLLFNPTNNGFCDYPYNVNCHGKPVEVPPTNPTQPAPGQVVTLRPPGSPQLLNKCLSKRGLFPSYSCNTFVNCWDGYAVEQNCPPGLVFSLKGYCDYPYNVDCNNRPFIHHDEPSPPQQAVPDKPNVQHDDVPIKPNVPEVVFPPQISWTQPPPPPQHTVPEKPNVQHDDVPIKPNVPEVVFPPQISWTQPSAVSPSVTAPSVAPQKPEHSWEAPSITLPSVTVPSVPIITVELATPDPNLVKKCGEKNGLFASTACNKYVNCWDGFAVEQSCPPALVFSNKGYCDFPINVDCNSRPLDASFFATVPPSSSSLPPVTETVSTSKPQVFQDELATSEAPKEPQANTTAVKQCDGIRGQFATKNCNTYLECWDGLGTERECPPGLFFSSVSGYCDYRHKVNCQDRTVQTFGFKSECPAPDGTFRSSTNCSQYYVCQANSVTSKHECPNGLKFNDVIGVCDYAYRVDCTRLPYIHQLNKNLNTLQKVPAGLLDKNIGCIPGRLFKLNLECNSVAICRNQVTEFVTCPQGMSYDTPTDRCTHPQLARCQDVL